MSAQWFVIRIRPQHRLEFDVLHALNQREHQAMVPYELKWEKRKRGQRMETKKYPMFPCYVFGSFSGYGDFLQTKLAINQRYEGMGKRPPIVGLIGYGAKPATLTDDEVNQLRNWSSHIPTQINLHKAIQPGGRAEITRGQFTGHVVTVDSVTRKKAKVMLSLFNSMHVVTIDASALVAA